MKHHKPCMLLCFVVALLVACAGPTPTSRPAVQPTVVNTVQPTAVPPTPIPTQVTYDPQKAIHDIFMRGIAQVTEPGVRSLMIESFNTMDDNIVVGDQTIENRGGRFEYLPYNGESWFDGDTTIRDETTPAVACIPQYDQVAFFAYPLLTQKEIDSLGDGIAVVDGVPMIPVLYRANIPIYSVISPIVRVTYIQGKTGEAQEKGLDQQAAIFLKELATWGISRQLMLKTPELADKADLAWTVECVMEGQTEPIWIETMSQSFTTMVNLKGRFLAGVDVAGSVATLPWVYDSVVEPSPYYSTAVEARTVEITGYNWDSTLNIFRWVTGDLERAANFPHAGDMNQVP